MKNPRIPESKDNNTRLEWVGAAMGLLGSFLIAVSIENGFQSGAGFLCFLVSNMCWIAVGFNTKCLPMILMQIGFTSTSLIGIYNHMLRHYLI